LTAELKPRDAVEVFTRRRRAGHGT
jgi:hypothetical protein